MLRRTWEATPHAMLVLEGLKGTPLVVLGPKQQLRQAPYDPWRDQGLAPASNAGEVHEPSQREARVAGEQARLKPLVGERTRERNNSDAGLGCADPPRPWSPNARKAGGRGYGCAQLRPRGGAPVASGPTCTSSSGGRSTRNGVGG